MPAGAGLTVEPACLTPTVLEPSRAWPARSPAVSQQLGDRLGPGSGGTTLGRLGEPRKVEGTWLGRGVGRGVQQGLRALAWEEGGHARRGGLQVGLETLSLSRFSRRKAGKRSQRGSWAATGTPGRTALGGMGRGQNVLGTERKCCGEKRQRRLRFQAPGWGTAGGAGGQVSIPVGRRERSGRCLVGRRPALQRPAPQAGVGRRPLGRLTASGIRSRGTRREGVPSAGGLREQWGGLRALRASVPPV